jgi:iron-sulfur cluster repair protein YtfE (RIC family)
VVRKKTACNGKSGQLPREGETLEMTDGNLLAIGIQTVNELAEIYSKVSSSVDSRRTVKTDNDVKMLRAETDARKEDDRHREQMAKLEQERLKLSSLDADKEVSRSMLRETFNMLKDQHEFYQALSKEEFLDERVTERVDKLNDIISALAMSLIKAL